MVELSVEGGAGTFSRRGVRDFWDVRSGSKAATIELERENYRRLIGDVADPPGTVAMLNGGLGRAARVHVARRASPSPGWVRRDHRGG